MATKSFLGLVQIDAIRSVIGVDSKDLADSVICDRAPEDDLESDLLTWVPTYQTIISEGVTGTPTSEQALKYLKLRIYAKYFIAGLVVSAGGNSILQKLSDGSNEASRFTNVDLRQLKKDIDDMAASTKAELVLLVTPTSDTSYSQFGTAVPEYDPVTNTTP